MTLDEEKRSMRESYWNERERADAEREGESTSPEMDSGDDSEAADMEAAESPEGVPDFNVPDLPYASPPMVSTEKPPTVSAENPTDELRKRRIAALQEASRLAAAPLSSPGGDAEIAKAQASDRAQRGRDAVTEAIQGWLLRQPVRARPPQDAEDLIKRRQLAESSELKQRQQQLSAQQLLARALAGDKTTGGLTDYQKALVGKWERSEEAKRAIAAAKKEKEEKDRNAWLETTIGSGRYTEGLRALGGGDLQKGIEKFKTLDMKSGQDLQNAWEQDKGRATTIEAAKIARNEKTAEEKSQDIPPGYEVVPGANPGHELRKEFSKKVASNNKMHILTRDFRKLMSGVTWDARLLDYGTKQAIEQAAEKINLEAKNVGDLGALSGPDQAIIERIAGNPGSIWTFAAGDVNRLMNGLDTWGDAEVKSKQDAYGFRRVGGGTGLKTRKMKNGGVAYQGRKSGAWFTTQEEAEAN